MNKKWAILIAVSIILAGFVFNIVLSNQKEEVKRKSRNNKLSPKKIIIIGQKSYPLEITLSGPLHSLNRISIHSEVSGIMKQRSQQFRAGNNFDKDEVMLQIQDEEYRNNLLSNKSSLMNQITSMLPDMKIDYPQSVDKWRSYLQEFELEEDLSPLPDPANDQERYFLASRNIYTQYYQIKSMETKLDKYNIKAPFSGTLTKSEVNPGTMIKAGQKIGEFISNDIYEMEAFAGLKDISKVKVGKEVTLTNEEIPGKFKGKIDRINSEIDRSSQTIKVYIITKDERLRDGLYMQAHIKSKSPSNSARIPKTAVTNNKVWTVKDSTLSRRKVNIYDEQDDHFIVTDLPEGTKIIQHSSKNLRENMKINAHNKSKPKQKKSKQ